MKNIFKFLDNSIGFINRFISAFGISMGVALAFVNVVARYVFNYSFTWASELTIYLFLWSAFFGAAYCFKVDAHISINILLEKLEPKKAKYLMLLSHSITMVFLAFVAYFGYEYLLLVIDLEETSIDLEIPMWIPYLVIPVSFAFGAFRVLERIYSIYKTPAEDVLQQSETQMIIEEMCKLDETAQTLVKEVERKTGGML